MVDEAVDSPETGRKPLMSSRLGTPALWPVVGAAGVLERLQGQFPTKRVLREACAGKKCGRQLQFSPRTWQNRTLCLHRPDQGKPRRLFVSQGTLIWHG